MTHFLCTACGTQFAESVSEPNACPICQDARQYVGRGGQTWTTLDRLRRERRQSIQQVEEGLVGIGIDPSFGIGQRALLVRTPTGNVLWDCVALLDEALIEMIRGRGGLSAIAISHPHYYTTMVEWARAFECPVHLHAADAKWVMRPDRSIEFWEGETRELLPGVTLIRCGGHFAGGTVLHWREGAEGRGALLSGDILQVTADRRWVSFMYSYPNFIPLSADAVRRIAAAVDPFAFDRIHGAFWGWTVDADARAAVRRSAERYVRALAEAPE